MDVDVLVYLTFHRCPQVNKGALSSENKKYIDIHKYINSHLPEAPSVCCCAALILLNIYSAIVVY